MSQKEQLEALLKRRRCTLLGIGPMSKNCVDAVLELGNEYNVPIQLIASRRQIESDEQGGGYVNNWSTEEFARYVKERDKRGNVIISRDHGGPWQNLPEVCEKMSAAEAMASARRSFEVDIDSGFEALHIDPSVDIHIEGEPPLKVVLERLFELYEYCYVYARRRGRRIFFEVGTDEQSGDQQNLDGFEDVARQVTNFCKRNKLPQPFFIVVQTGTKVKETGNVGNLNGGYLRGTIPPKVYVHKLVELCERYGLHLKEHNADYLSDELLEWHPRVGIHAINVAPELGVCETRHILRVCDELGLKKEEEQFLELAHSSKKWEKWLMPGSTATDYEKAVIAGHYVFSTPEFTDLKGRVASACAAHGIDLDFSIKEKLKHCTRRYLHTLNLV